MLIKLLKLYILLVLITFNSLVIHGQNLPSFPTPNTAAQNVFLQYPESSFTGVPSIRIPVCQLKSHELDLSFSLSYNTNLVKPRNFGSWVGLGWNLNGEGSISRVVNDKPDEMKWVSLSAYIMFQEEQVGYKYNHSYLSALDWTSTDKITLAMLDVRKNYNYQPSPNADYALTVKDYAPDEFSFSIGDLSGRFYMDDQGQWKVKSNVKVDVLINEEDYVGYTTPSMTLSGKQINFPVNFFINKITLVDHRGIKYIFGGKPNANEKDSNYSTQYSTWHIAEIRFPDGKSISYDYEKGQKVVYSMPTRYNLPQYDNHTVYSDSVGYSPIYLRKISVDDEQIEFFRSENAREFAKLDSIKCTTYTGRQIRTIAFTYLNRPMDRLKLAKIYFKDMYALIKEQYQFIYNEKSFTYNLNTDHWGYFTTKQIGVPDLPTSRIPDTASCRAELLSEVVYPTGGSALYTWEPNDCSKVVTNDRTRLDVYNYNSSTGGVRIKQISFLDQNRQLADFKKYCYNKNYGLSSYVGLSSGIRYSYPQYGGVSYEVMLSPGLPLQENNVGSHVSYSQVTEINSDGSYTVTDFSNFDTGLSNEYMDEAPLGYKGEGFSPKYYTSHSHERGFPLEIRAYTNAGTILSKKEIQYTRLSSQSMFVKSYLGGLLDGTWFDPFGRYKNFYNWSGSAVKFYLNPYLQSRVKETMYNNGAANQELVANYTYDEKTYNVLNQERVNSKGEVVNTSFSYPNNAVDQGIDNSGLYAMMINAHFFGLPIDITTKVSGIQTELKHFDYTQVMPGLFKPLAEIATFGTGPAHVINHYDAYDSRNGNLLSVSKENGPPVSYQWGYHDLLPIAKVVNAKALNFDIKEFYCNNFEEETTDFPDWGLVKDGNRAHTGQFSGRLTNNSSTEAALHCNTWRQVNLNGKAKRFTYSGWIYSDGPSVDIFLFMKKPGEQGYYTYVDVVSTGETGKWVYLEKEYEVPADVSELNLRLDNNSAGSVWFDDLRLYPSDAEMTTYTYEPLVGITSESDARGQATYYEYDSLQRLRCVKDRNGRVIKQMEYHYRNQ